MNVGIVGLGKLGFPVGMAIESKGHKVIGYDINPHVQTMIDNKKMEYREIDAQEHIEKTEIKVKTMEEVVKNSEIIFIAIQTPHERQYEGDVRIPNERVDFDYSWLKEGVKNVAEEIKKQGTSKVVIIISTVLPGTVEREIYPLLNEYVKLCYNPFFIAMGTTMPDFLNPEFVLFGVDDEEAAMKAEEFYKTLHNKPFFKTSVKSAELIKVCYNTYIGMKIVFANTMMEICEHTGANVNDITEAMGLADDRLMSKKYLYGGMGDGGGCHPRDNIAMSWLARKLNLSHDFFEDIMKAREDQTEWLATLMEHYQQENQSDTLPMVILGKSFKKETNILTGSPAILLKNILEERGHEVKMYDPYIDNETLILTKAVYLIGTQHEKFSTYAFPGGSIVIDPWRYIPHQDGVTIIRLGENK